MWKLRMFFDYWRKGNLIHISIESCKYIFKNILKIKILYYQVIFSAYQSVQSTHNHSLENIQVHAPIGQDLNI